MIDIDKHYKTREGQQVVIHTVSAPDKRFPVIGSVCTHAETDNWEVATWTAEGRHFGEDESEFDLFECPTLYGINVYPAGGRSLIRRKKPRKELRIVLAPFQFEP